MHPRALNKFGNQTYFGILWLKKRKYSLPVTTFYHLERDTP